MYTTKIQQLVRERCRELSWTLKELVNQYVGLVPGLPNTFLNRKKKRNSIARIWDGGTKDPHLSLFIRLINALGGKVIVRWEPPDNGSLKAEEELQAVDFERFDSNPEVYKDTPSNE